MLAVHISPGPRGFGVERDDGTLICYGMTWHQAVYTARGGRELDPKEIGNTRSLRRLAPPTGRIPRHTFSHNQAQGPEDFMT